MQNAVVVKGKIILAAIGTDGSLLAACPAGAIEREFQG